MNNPYEIMGYDTREEYLESLVDDFGLDKEIIFAAADLLGPSEDFDGLITTLEDQM